MSNTERKHGKGNKEKAPSWSLESGDKKHSVAGVDSTGATRRHSKTQRRFMPYEYNYNDEEYAYDDDYDYDDDDNDGYHVEVEDDDAKNKKHTHRATRDDMPSKKKYDSKKKQGGNSDVNIPRRRTPSPVLEDTASNNSKSTGSSLAVASNALTSTSGSSRKKKHDKTTPTSIAESSKSTEESKPKPHTRVDKDTGKQSMSDEACAKMLAFLCAGSSGVREGMKYERRCLIESPDLFSYEKYEQSLSDVEKCLQTLALSDYVDKTAVAAYKQSFAADSKIMWYPSVAVNLPKKDGNTESASTSASQSQLYMCTDTVNIGVWETTVSMDVNVVSDKLPTVDSPVKVSSAVLRQRLLELYPQHEGQVLVDEIAFRGTATYNDMDCNVSVKQEVQCDLEDVKKLWMLIENNCPVDAFDASFNAVCKQPKLLGANNNGILGTYTYDKAGGARAAHVGVSTRGSKPIAQNYALKQLLKSLEHDNSDVFLQTSTGGCETVTNDELVLAHLCLVFKAQNEMALLQRWRSVFASKVEQNARIKDVTPLHTWIPVPTFASLSQENKETPIGAPSLSYSQYFAVKNFAESLTFMKKKLRIKSDGEFSEYVHKCMVTDTTTKNVQWIAFSTELLLKELLKQHVMLQQFPVRPRLGINATDLQFHFFVPPCTLALSPHNSREVAQKKGLHISGTIVLRCYLPRTSKVKRGKPARNAPDANFSAAVNSRVNSDNKKSAEDKPENPDEVTLESIEKNL